MAKKSPCRLPHKLQPRTGQQIQLPMTPHQHSQKGQALERGRPSNHNPPPPAFPTEIGGDVGQSQRD
uniref:Uncharacterized protein n=1 Tax=Arundo donax TaxID=35708 RepID=A0A0A9FBD4_ARUDO